jgi:molybdenum cofactor cytidylyltransferase
MDPKMPIAGIILAAGMSLRFGRPKQLEKIGDKTLVEIAVDAALESKLDHIVLVLGYAFDAVVSALRENRTRDPRLTILQNRAFQEGMSGSLRIGLNSVKDAFSSVMFLLADQPMIQAQTINLLLDAFIASEKGICAPVFHHKRGNPTLFSKRFFPQLLSIQGDRGAREIIRNAAAQVDLVEVNAPGVIIDIDTPADLEKLA